MTQNEQVLDYLKKHKGITSIEAINNFGITRLSARIADLRRDGHIIGAESVTYKKTDGKKTTFVRYSLLEAKHG